ncbi:hypothetical protein LQ567_22840 [Niabella pedocola]|uniref:Uncharacterized protein n=1 Tax=Niabella pedocola TaxID=1752077 RepID=A0ABS8PX51_9BACT|nr:hypothetical protein [Niabella pedocola]MCD2425639.1 hypothetical protein [Niabella pedocola]
MEYFSRYNNSYKKLVKIIFFIGVFGQSFITPNMVQAQFIFDGKGIDSILLGRKVSKCWVSELKAEDLLYVQLGILKIDGTCNINKGKINEATPVTERIYCRRIGGKIRTLYWLVTKSDTSLTNRLQALYGKPYQTIRPIMRSSDDEIASMVWVFSDYSIYYWPDFVEYKNRDLIVVNYHKEADFLRSFPEKK